MLLISFSSLLAKKHWGKKKVFSLLQYSQAALAAAKVLFHARFYVNRQSKNAITGSGLLPLKSNWELLEFGFAIIEKSCNVAVSNTEVGDWQKAPVKQ